MRIQAPGAGTSCLRTLKPVARCAGWARDADHLLEPERKNSMDSIQPTPELIKGAAGSLQIVKDQNPALCLNLNSTDLANLYWHARMVPPAVPNARQPCGGRGCGIGSGHAGWSCCNAPERDCPCAT